MFRLLAPSIFALSLPACIFSDDGEPTPECISEARQVTATASFVEKGTLEVTLTPPSILGVTLSYEQVRTDGHVTTAQHMSGGSSSLVLLIPDVPANTVVEIDVVVHCDEGTNNSLAEVSVGATDGGVTAPVKFTAAPDTL